MSTRQQLDSLAVVALACFFVDVTIGRTWYLEVVFWAAFLAFWTICGLSWWDRTHALNDRAPPSKLDEIREDARGPIDADSTDHHKAAPSSMDVNTSPSNRPYSELLQFHLRRLVVHVGVSILMFAALVVVAHLNVFVAAAVVLTGQVLSIVLQLGK